MIQELFQLYADRWQFFLKLTLQHLEISLIAIVAALCIGLSLGILISSYRRSSSLVLGLTNFMYTIPSIALFGFLIPFSGIGDTTAIFALTVYALLPMVRNTYTGITGIDREIIEAARLAGAERFIMALKDGFDTYVGERGVKLSGGQKQRIAIARVFLKNPPILILDEATSALDNESEILVGQSLEKLAHGRTTLTIAHRLTTIKNYDRILVLGSEGIVESGTHEELLAKQGVYYRLWNQLPGEDTL